MTSKALSRYDIEQNLIKIRSYFDKNYTNEVKPQQKDFYNLITGEVTCGKCGKTVSAFKSIFHWCLFN